MRRWTFDDFCARLRADQVQMRKEVHLRSKGPSVWLHRSLAPSVGGVRLAMSSEVVILRVGHELGRAWSSSVSDKNDLVVGQVIRFGDSSRPKYMIDQTGSVTELKTKRVVVRVGDDPRTEWRVNPGALESVD